MVKTGCRLPRRASVSAIVHCALRISNDCNVPASGSEYYRDLKARRRIISSYVKVNEPPYRIMFRSGAISIRPQ